MNAQRYAPIVLRLGLAGLFLWFGLSQALLPNDWIAWVPGWAENLFGDARTVVLFNGAFETLCGILLLAGIFTRWVALLLGLHLLLIAYEIGYDAIAIRDLCIAVSCFALSLFGADDWSLRA